MDAETKRLLVRDLFPQEGRTDIEEFVIENRGVYDAVALLLKSATEKRFDVKIECPPLVGGDSQLHVLYEIAHQGGLLFESDIRDLVVHLRVPNRPSFGVDIPIRR